MTARTAAAVALVVGGLAAGAALVATADEQPAAVTERSAADLATDSCVRLRLVLQAITADSAADNVRRQLADARGLAAAAAQKDSAYVGLSGGAAALAEALERDDPAAADLAVRVVRASCG